MRTCPNCSAKLHPTNPARDGAFHENGCVLAAMAEVLVARGYAARAVYARVASMDRDRFNDLYDTHIGPAVDALEEALGL